MGRLIESTFVTLDGVVGSPEKWGSPYWDEEHSAYGQSLLERADALLLGRATYDVFASSWPSRGGDPYSDRMNALPKFVATHQTDTPTWQNTTFLTGDLATAVQAVKDQVAGDVLKFGTGEVDRDLLEHSLIDEFHFWVFPVIAGDGRRLLDGMVDLTHLGARGTVTFRSGIVVHVCAPR
jgi:dihydrofolate reductase